MSNQARQRDIVALLARGIVRVKKQPLVAAALEPHMPGGDAFHAGLPSQHESMQATGQCQQHVDSAAPNQQGGDQ